MQREQKEKGGGMKGEMVAEKKKRRALLVNSTRQSRRENFIFGHELLKPGRLSRSPLCLPTKGVKVDGKDKCSL